MNPIAIRLLSQQLVSPQLASPKEVVAHMGAMQAQDYRMMRWAVMMRMKKPSAEAFRLAYDAGEIVRLHLLRGTWQLVSANDYGWMLQLFAEKSERVIRGWMKSNKVFIDDEELYSFREILVDTCERKLLRDNDVLGYGSVSHLLPPFDEYLIGYKSRELPLSPSHTHHAHTNNGIFFPIIAHDGIICGNWTPWEKNLKTSFFLPLEEELSFDKQWKAFCQLKNRR